MALDLVNLSTDVYMVCLNHALSTEREEIVGLLVGEVDENHVAHVSAVVLLRRSDKRKDRVEISPEQLSSASTEAERLTNLLHRPMRVLGWYHSHPHITVWPSFVDVRTQASYQMMDEGFVGIIFSVFNEDSSTKVNRIQVTCFQSASKGNDESTQNMRVEIPLHIVPTNHISSVNLNALIQLPRFLCQEEQIAYQTTNQRELDFLTRLHNSSVYTKSMCHIAEVVCGPLLQTLEARLYNNEIKRGRLEEKRRELINLLQQIYRESCRDDGSEASSDVENTVTQQMSPRSGNSSPSENAQDLESSPKSEDEASPKPVEVSVTETTAEAAPISPLDPEPNVLPAGSSPASEALSPPGTSYPSDEAELRPEL